MSSHNRNTPAEPLVTTAMLDGLLAKRCSECPSNGFTQKAKGALILVAALLGLLGVAGPAWLASRTREIVREELRAYFPAHAQAADPAPVSSGVLIGQAQAAGR